MLNADGHFGGTEKPGGSLNFVNVFLLFNNNLPLENDLALHLNKLESTSPKDVLCQVWLILVWWFWRRKFFYFVNVFFA